MSTTLTWQEVNGGSDARNGSSLHSRAGHRRDEQPLRFGDHEHRGRWQSGRRRRTDGAQIRGSGLTARPGYVSGDDVGGVPIEADPSPVIAHGRPRVSVRSRFLNIAERYAGIESGSDEGVAQRVRADRLVDPGATCDPSHDAASGVTVEAPAIC